jgi:diacylglycerol kinase family enzyme
VIVNEDAGTVRSLGPASAHALLTNIFAATKPRIEMAAAENVIPLVEKALASDALDTIVIGGGDGTISSAAGKIAGTGKAMGVLPLGTMNLFARALGMPLALEDAAKAIAAAKRVAVDVGQVNGRIFLHHVSLGLHPRMEQFREQIGYGSRLGKMVNSVRAFLQALLRPPKLRFDLLLDENRISVVSPAILVSNNRLGEGHAPYPDRLDEGLLALHVVNSFRRRDIVVLAGSLLAANWQASAHVDIQTGKKIEIRSLKSGWRRRSRILASIDGELEEVRAPLRLEILPGALIVLATESGRPP